MPKGKEKDAEKEPRSKYDPDDVAAFVDALEAADETPPDDDQTSDDESAEDATDAGAVPEVSVRSGRHVPVAVEASSDDQMATNQPPAEELHRVLATHHDGTPPEEMKKLTSSSRRHFPWGWTIGILVLLAAASVGGFFWFNRTAKFSGSRIDLQIKSNSHIASGNDVTLTLQYQNAEPIDVTNSELTVEYPDGFTYRRSSAPATNDFHNAFSLGTLKSGRAGQLTITGTVVGAVDSTRTFTATLTYRPANFNSDFQQKTSITVTISSSILSLGLSGPTKMAPNATGTWTITYANTSDRDLENIEIDATYPDGFAVATTNPAATEHSSLWRLPKIGHGQKGTITFTGKATGSIGDSLEFKAGIGVVGTGDTIDLQDQQTLLAILVNTGLSASIAANGVTDNSVIAPGDTVNYAVQVTNKSDVEVADVTVAATLDGAALDMSQLTNTDKAVVKNQTLTWTKNEFAGLALIKPGQDITFHFSVGTKTALAVAKDSDRDQHLTAAANVTAPALAVNAGSAPAQATLLTKISTVMAMKAEARYYSEQGAPLGSGPIPPAVGQTTSYRVYWSVTNTTSDAANLSVSTTLPVTVYWTGQNVSRDAGDIAFDATTRTVRWTLNKVPAGTGSRLPTLTASFEVSITPTTDQVGSVVVLTDTTTATAQDSYGGQPLTATQPSLTSAVPTDAKAGGEGTVVAGT